jgi:chromosome partitioning protein
MGVIISLANQKGGVGKTTLTIHLAVGLARMGRRVAIVDADPQGNASSWLLDGDVSDAGLFRLLVVGDPLVKVMRTAQRWGVGLLPGNSRTGEAMAFLAATGRLAAIPGLLEPLRQAAEIVLLDMPPSRAAGFAEMLQASQWVIVPTQLERLALEGVVLMAQMAEELRRRGLGPRLLGVAPNMVRQTKEHQAQMRDLVAAFGATVWPPIPLAVDVAEASAYGTVIFDHAPKAKVTRAMQQIVSRCAENLGGV